MTIKTFTMLVFASGLLGSCSTNLKEAQAQSTDANNFKFLDPANMDTKEKPTDNFFMYANGSWLKNNPVPATETRWGSFNTLEESNLKILHELLEEAAKKNAPLGSNEQKVGDFYKSGMDTTKIDKIGLLSLKPWLDRINNLKTWEDVLNEIVKEHSEGIGPVFSFYVAPDDKNVTKPICQLYQGGLGLPDRDFYFSSDMRAIKIREEYKLYINKIFELQANNYEDMSIKTADIMNLETTLAKASMTRVDMRDPYKLYNKYSIANFSTTTRNINWKNVLTSLNIKGEDSIIVAQPGFFYELSLQLKKTSVEAWKAYLTFHLINGMAPFLSKAFDEARFNFYGKVIRGQQKQQERWKRTLRVVDGSVGMLLGQMYVDKTFKPEAKQRMLDLVNNLQQTYADRINRLDWMSLETKKQALAKLNTFIKKIGYPDKWKDYSKLNVVPDDYVKNVIASATFEFNYNISRLGKPVDRTEWGMTPPTVNAYYNPAFNEIVFPAGILQYPFFSDKADDAVNYGGIGAVIGHEMTHGFDDQGSKYDAEGNLKNWWTADDEKKFKEKTNLVENQFDNYTVLDTVKINGKLTLGENLADLGGLAIAYEAFKKTKQGQSSEKIDGFTPDQRFFLSWAQVWRANTRDEELFNRIKTDPHSPNEWRCNGPLSNMPEFYKAFDVKPGDKMYRPDSIRAKVW